MSLALALVVTVLGSAQVASQSTDPRPKAGPTSEVVLRSDVKWGPLNPTRGDKSPRAGTLWGDRTAAGPTGFLVQFVDGFKSPPHIHNVSYRGVVISGLIHNDDPAAKAMWMPAGSFWTQPAGEVHITAAKGSNNMAYIEIEKGPYLVLSTKEAFDSGERPVNADPSNIVWLDASNTTWINRPASPASAKGPEIAFLWGNPREDQENGTLVRLPAEFAGTIRTRSSTFRAVVIQGRPDYQVQSQTDVKTMEPGSYFNSKGEVAHQFSCKMDEGCIIYVRTKGKFEVIPGQPKK